MRIFEIIENNPPGTDSYVFHTEKLLKLDIGVSVVQSPTLTVAISTITGEPNETLAFEPANRIITSGIIVTVIGTCGTFIHIYTESK